MVVSRRACVYVHRHGEHDYKVFDFFVWLPLIWSSMSDLYKPIQITTIQTQLAPTPLTYTPFHTRTNDSSVKPYPIFENTKSPDIIF